MWTSLPGHVSPGERCKVFYKRISVDGVSKTPLKFERLKSFELSSFIEEAERLSRIAGVNPETVTKKLPPPPKSAKALEGPTLIKWLEAEYSNTLANVAFGVGVISSTNCEPSELLRKAGPAFNGGVPGLYGLRYCFQAVLGDYKRGKEEIAFGPGQAVVAHDKRSSGRFEKLDAFCVRSNKLFYPWQWIPLDKQELGLTRWFSAENLKLTPARQVQVPKSAKVNRTITVGTPAQISAQFQIDKGIRACLRRRGVDLNTLANTNRLKAWVGSSRGGIATLDLSSASDTISIGLLAFLCKGNQATEKLFAEIMTTRSQTVSVPHHEGPYWVQGVDGMGNPAIFSLESALFLAINAWFYTSHWSVREDPPVWTSGTTFKWFGRDFPWAVFASFGDDQAPPDGVPIEDWGLIYSKLFMKLNVEKSFGLKIGSCDSFRESCGCDFEDGHYVRGFYLQTREPTLLDAVRLYNYFTLYYGLTEDDKSSKLYHKVKRLTVGAWINPRVYRSSSLFGWNRRVPESQLLVHGLTGSPKRTLIFSAGMRKQWKLYNSTNSLVDSVDIALTALDQGGTSEVSFWHAAMYRFKGGVRLREESLPFLAIAEVRDDEFGERTLRVGLRKARYRSFWNRLDADLAFGLTETPRDWEIAGLTRELSTLAFDS